MTSTPVAEQDQAGGGWKERLRENFGFKILSGAISLGLTFWLFFGAAGRYDWIQGWAYVAMLTLGQIGNALYIRSKNPELLKRRGTFGEGTKGWDKAVLPLFGFSYLAVMLVGALDGSRFLWFPLPWWTSPLGAMLYLGGLLIVTWAMVRNTHFEKTVRIQKDRGHKVIDKGPYRLVRHPGYIGTILGFPLAAPLLLCSLWAFLPATICIGFLVLRTFLEDRTLRAELEGYASYAERVGYRLIPGLW